MDKLEALEKQQLDLYRKVFDLQKDVKTLTVAKNFQEKGTKESKEEVDKQRQRVNGLRGLILKVGEEIDDHIKVHEDTPKVPRETFWSKLFKRDY